MVAPARNVLKTVRKPGLGIGTLGPQASADTIAVIAGCATGDTVVDFAAPSWRFVCVSLVGSLPQAGAAVNLLSVRRLSQLTPNCRKSTDTKEIQLWNGKASLNWRVRWP